MIVCERIEEYLSELQQLIYDTNRYTGDGLLMDVIDLQGEFLDETDYYGWNMSGKNRMKMLSFTGQSNHFAAFYVQDQDHEEDLDEVPLYYCDIASDKEPELLGNFRQYMTKYWQDCKHYLEEMDELDFVSKRQEEEENNIAFQKNYPDLPLDKLPSKLELLAEIGKALEGLEQFSTNLVMQLDLGTLTRGQFESTLD